MCGQRQRRHWQHCIQRQLRSPLSLSTSSLHNGQKKTPNATTEQKVNNKGEQKTDRTPPEQKGDECWICTFNTNLLMLHLCMTCQTLGSKCQQQFWFTSIMMVHSSQLIVNSDSCSDVFFWVLLLMQFHIWVAFFAVSPTHSFDFAVFDMWQSPFLFSDDLVANHCLAIC